MAHIQVRIAVGNLNQNWWLLKLMVGHRDAEQKLNRELKVGDVLDGILSNGPAQRCYLTQHVVRRIGTHSFIQVSW